MHLLEYGTLPLVFNPVMPPPVTPLNECDTHEPTTRCSTQSTRFSPLGLRAQHRKILHITFTNSELSSWQSPGVERALAQEWDP